MFPLSVFGTLLCKQMQDKPQNYTIGHGERNQAQSRFDASLTGIYGAKWTG
ncbi:hypothetical protein VHA_001710 [Grimontia hollisae CIP 101886]|uniref:Uncharacterized protein n=1 Tax=Grimontia hollisae CIP 101886 TaxID=675812 RepID=D0I7I6_GRIHO|nr:hypothetical protein VHA_001710 [Grimontia hollisae CIP 101886]